MLAHKLLWSSKSQGVTQEDPGHGLVGLGQRAALVRSPNNALWGVFQKGSVFGVPYKKGISGYMWDPIFGNSILNPPSITVSQSLLKLFWSFLEDCGSGMLESGVQAPPVPQAHQHNVLKEATHSLGGCVQTVQASGKFSGIVLETSGAPGRVGLPALFEPPHLLKARLMRLKHGVAVS